MSAVVMPPAHQPPQEPIAPELATPASKPLSPNQRAWLRFKRNRLGAVLVLLGTLVQERLLLGRDLSLLGGV